MATTEPVNPELSRAKLFLRLLLATSFAVLLLRVQALRGLGLADVEALFASYALHPQPAYSFHPGLVGVVMRWIGGGAAPQPESVHLFAAALAALVPWAALLGARGTGASWGQALTAALACATLPAFIIGHSALTPDLLLMLIWLGAIGATALAIRAEPGTWTALLAWLGAGLLAGLGVMSHAVGGPLAVALIGAGALHAPRPRWRHAPLGAAVVIAAILASPVVGWAIAHGLALFHSDLVGLAAAPSILHATWIITGWALLLTPFPLLAVILVAGDLARQRNADRVSSLLWTTTVASAALVLPLALVAPSSSPSWLLPPLVPLVFHLARRPTVVRQWLGAACVATAAVAASLGWIWLKTAVPVETLGHHYPAQRDVANQLHAWGPGRALLIDALAATVVRRRELPVVVGVTPGTCAQAQATVGHQVRVGCMLTGVSDFDSWVPSRDWFDADSVLLVYDDRVTENPTTHFPNHTVVALSKTDVRRGGRVVRTIRVAALDKVRDIAGSPREPAIRTPGPRANLSAQDEH